MIELIDIGLNLAHRSFDKDRSAVMERAHAAGVGHMIITGTSASASEAAATMARDDRERLSATAGTHPHHAKEFSADTATAIRTLAARDEVVAIGECGLDFNRNFSTPDDQRACLRAQLEIAADVQLPVFLHERDAHQAMCEILEPFASRLAGMVVHCFTGGPEQAERYLAMGASLGITGWVCDERRGQALREAVAVIPDDRLMLETDAPFLTPRDAPKGTPRRNEPAMLPHVLAAVAKLRAQTPEAVAAAATANTRKFFGLT
ncbi:MAG: TatD family hydrolase [Nannocystales bacterium]